MEAFCVWCAQSSRVTMRSVCAEWVSAREPWTRWSIARSRFSPVIEHERATRPHGAARSVPSAETA